MAAVISELDRIVAELRRMTADELLSDGSCTVPQAVREFGIGRSVIYDLMTAGLPFAKFNTRRLIPRRALKLLVAAGMAGVGR